MGTFTLKRFISYSIAIHLILMLLVYFVPLINTKQKTKPSPFFAILVNPNEIGLETGKPRIPLSKRKDISNLQGKTQSKSLSSKQTTDLQSKSITGELVPLGKGSPFPLKKEQLFDTDVIKKFAKKNLGKDVEKEKVHVNLELLQLKYYAYTIKLVYSIGTNWHLPSDYIKGNFFGTVTVQYTIKKNGELENVELLHTSGHKSLDDSAINAIKESALFQPIPDTWGEDTYTGLISFNYPFFDINEQVPTGNFSIILH
jgi:TonB family protein